MQHEQPWGVGFRSEGLGFRDLGFRVYRGLGLWEFRVERLSRECLASESPATDPVESNRGA